MASGTTRPLDPDPGHTLRSTRVTGHLGHDVPTQCPAIPFTTLRTQSFWQWPPFRNKILLPPLLSSRTALAPPTSIHYQLAWSHFTLRFQTEPRLLPPTRPTTYPSTTASRHQQPSPTQTTAKSNSIIPHNPKVDTNLNGVTPKPAYLSLPLQQHSTPRSYYIGSTTASSQFSRRSINLRTFRRRQSRYLVFIGIVHTH